MSYERGGSATRDRIVDVIVAMTAENGYAPTIREIAEAIGLRSPDTVKFHLGKLRHEGRVSWREGASRTLRALVAPCEGRR